MSDQEELMSITEAAAAIGVSVATLRRAAKLGTLKATKIGPRAWVTTLAAAKAWQDNPSFHVRSPRKFRKLGD